MHSYLSAIFIDKGQLDLFISVMLSITNVGQTEHLAKVFSYHIILMTHIIVPTFKNMIFIDLFFREKGRQRKRKIEA